MADEENLTGLLARMSRTQKAWALVAGLVLAGAGAGVWYADLSTSFATKEALDAHIQTVSTNIEDVETAAAEALADERQHTSNDRQKLWSKVNEVSERTERIDGRLELLILLQSRQAARYQERQAIDERIEELRQGAPTARERDPVEAIRRDL